MSVINTLDVTAATADGELDALSQVLRSFRLRGSLLDRCELSAPWAISLVKANDAPFHFVEYGACVLITARGDHVDLAGGDIVVLFDGADHLLCDSPSTRAEPLGRVLAQMSSTPGPLRYGGGGLACRMICGRFAIDEHESGPATLRHLPPLVHVPRRSSDRSRSFAAALELLAAEMDRREIGSQRAASLLTEMLLIQVIRQVLAGQAQPSGQGWVEGLRDPHIAAALAAIHGNPEQPWSVESLATRTGLCRSLFAARFVERVGSTPMSYLAHWRLQLAARLLRETELTISEISDRLGYRSAASFDRSFKRIHQISPSAYKRAVAGAIRPMVQPIDRAASSGDGLSMVARELGERTG